MLWTDTDTDRKGTVVDTLAKEKFLRWYNRLDVARYRLTPGQSQRERAATLKIMRQLTTRARVKGWKADDVQAGRN
jgi:hypothetical protein